MKNNNNCIVADIPELVKCFRAIIKDPIQGIGEILDQKGPVVRFSFGGRNLVISTNPGIAKQLLYDNYLFADRKSSIQPLVPLLGSGIFVSEHQSWLNERKTMSPYFFGSLLDKYIKPLADDFIREFTILADKGESFGLEKKIKEILLEINLKILVSPDVKPDRSLMVSDLDTFIENAAIHSHMKNEIKEFMLGAIGLKPGRSRKVSAALSRINTFTDQLVDDLKNGKLQKAPLIEMLFEKYEEKALSLQQIKDEIKNILFAGFDTTAGGLFWSFWLIENNPEKKRNMTEEIERLKDDTLDTQEKLRTLGYIRKICFEALRLYPPAWMFTRQILDEIPGFEEEIPLKSYFVLPVYHYHRNPEIWKAPDDFIPERFDDEAVTNSINYLAFGQGPHKCIGSRLAIMELVIYLNEFYKNFEFEIIQKSHPGINPGIIMKSRNDWQVALRRK